MAIDFPPSPTVGTKHPSTPVEGVPTYTWDGEKWVTGLTSGSAFVAKAGDTMTGPLVLPADPTLALEAATKQYVDNKSQLISLSGLSTVDITVPATAVGVVMDFHAWQSTTTNSQTLVRFSTAAGVFHAGAADYAQYGFYNTSPVATVLALHANNGASALITNGHDLPTFPIIATMNATLVRPSSAGAFSITANGRSFNSTNSLMTSFYYNRLIASGPAPADTRILAMRVFSSTSVPWSAGSYINAKWF